VFYRISRRRILLKRIDSQSSKRHKLKRKMMTIRTLKMMARSTQGTSMKEKWEEEDLELTLRVMTLKFCPPLQV
jgi:hypothetical protein